MYHRIFKPVETVNGWHLESIWEPYGILGVPILNFGNGVKALCLFELLLKVSNFYQGRIEIISIKGIKPPIRLHQGSENSSLSQPFSRIRTLQIFVWQRWIKAGLGAQDWMCSRFPRWALHFSIGIILHGNSLV
ncbi:hypothetical protein CsSME_00046331 [Camellia sinensis var. sinensis]